MMPAPMACEHLFSGCSRREQELSKKPLQQSNATSVRSTGPWYARRRPCRSLLNGKSLGGQETFSEWVYE
jgi:hypothetical protein